MKQYLQFEKICMEFPGVKALDDMSFGVDKGEIVAFLGENGAGKSTLLKILNGDYRHTGGRIFINDKEAAFHSPNEAIRHTVCKYLCGIPAPAACADKGALPLRRFECNSNRSGGRKFTDRRKKI